jgi:signal transduction histidine kinase
MTSVEFSTRRARPTTSFRRRLTVLFVAVAVSSGALLAVSVYLLMANVATYSISDTFVSVDGSTPTTPGSAVMTDADAITWTSDTTGPFHVQDQSSLLRTLLGLSVIALVAMAAIGAITGAIVARRLARPIEAIGDVAADVQHGHLDRRVRLSGPDDELKVLADTFDDMLDTMQQSMLSYERFAANASHELRSPIAATQTLIDVTLADPDASADELRQLAERLRRINARNLATVDAILDLSDVRNLPHPRVDVDLSAIVAEVTAGARPAAEAANVVLDADIAPGVIVDAESTLVRQAVSNLVSNAIRHNTANGTASVSVAMITGHPVVRVSNTGPVIEPASIESLREPFVRTSGRAAGADTGRGLGLAIVDAIADVHHATLELSARPGGGLNASIVFASHA